jgi:hypothetical protein
MKLNLQRVVTTTALALSMSVSQTAFAERLPAKLFAQHAQYADVTLSPDGTASRDHDAGRQPPTS